MYKNEIFVNKAETKTRQGKFLHEYLINKLGRKEGPKISKCFLED